MSTTSERCVLIEAINQSELAAKVLGDICALVESVRHFSKDQVPEGSTAAVLLLMAGTHADEWQYRFEQDATTLQERLDVLRERALTTEGTL